MIKRTSLTSPSDMNTSKFFNDKIYVGKNSYYKGNKNYQCVMYANARSSEIAGKPITYWTGISAKKDIEKPLFNRYGFGNAATWIKDTNWEVGTVPKAGAIMVYGTSWGSGYGHVRIVEEVRGNKLLISGGREVGNNCAFKEIDIPQITSTGFMGYIYNPYVKEESKSVKSELLDLIKQLTKVVEGM